MSESIRRANARFLDAYRANQARVAGHERAAAVAAVAAVADAADAADDFRSTSTQTESESVVDSKHDPKLDAVAIPAHGSYHVSGQIRTQDGAVGGFVVSPPVDLPAEVVAALAARELVPVPARLYAALVADQQAKINAELDAAQERAERTRAAGVWARERAAELDTARGTLRRVERQKALLIALLDDLMWMAGGWDGQAEPADVLDSVHGSRWRERLRKTVTRLESSRVPRCGARQCTEHIGCRESPNVCVRKDGHGGWHKTLWGARWLDACREGTGGEDCPPHVYTRCPECGFAAESPNDWDRHVAATGHTVT